MLILEIFFTIIRTLVKIFIVFYLNKYYTLKSCDEVAYVPKKWSYSNSFEKYISKFLQQFSIDDQETFDLLSFKNSKYLFYCFNDFIKAYGNPTYKLLHTKKMLDTVSVKKIEEKKKQILIEKLIHSVEFEDLYATNPEKTQKS